MEEINKLCCFVEMRLQDGSARLWTHLHLATPIQTYAMIRFAIHYSAAEQNIHSQSKCDGRWYILLMIHYNIRYE